MSFLSGIRAALKQGVDYAYQTVEKVRNLKQEDFTAAAQKVSDAGMSVLSKVQNSCSDAWQCVYPSPHGEPNLPLEDALPPEGEEPGWEVVDDNRPKPQADVSLNDPYPEDNPGVAPQTVRRRKKVKDQ